MGKDRFTEHAQNQLGCKKCNLTKAVGNYYFEIVMIGREGHHLSRYIKESIFIRVNNPTFNNNVGKFNLPHLSDKVLIKTPGLKLNK